MPCAPLAAAILQPKTGQDLDVWRPAGRDAVIPVLIPLLLGGGAAAYAARRSADRKSKRRGGSSAAIDERTSGTAALPAHQAAPCEAPDVWGFLARWLVPEQDPGAGQAVESPSMVAKAPALPRSDARRSLLTYVLSPTGVTAILGTLVVIACVIPSFSATLFGTEIDLTATARPILVSAFVGIGTNFIAVKMLFHPQRRLPLIGIQGVIPMRKRQLVDAMARGIRENLLSAETVRAAIRDSGVVREGIDQFLKSARTLLRTPEFREDLEQLMGDSVRAFVGNPAFREQVFDRLEVLLRAVPPSMFSALGEDGPGWLRQHVDNWLTDKVRQNRDTIMSALDDQLGDIVEELCGQIVAYLEELPAAVEASREQVELHLCRLICDNAERIDIEEAIRAKMEGMDEGELEGLIQRSTDNELATIQYLGAGLGAIAGALLVAVG